MIHTFWVVQGTNAKKWYTTESINDKHNSVLTSWQVVDKLLACYGEVNLIKCKDGHFTEEVVKKTVAKPYYTVQNQEAEIKPAIEVSKNSKALIWNKLKALGYKSGQLKTDYDISYQQVSLSLLESILEQLQKVPAGVNENLSSECGGVTGNDINASNTSEAVETSDNKFKGIPVEHYQTIQDACLSALLPDVINNDQPVVVVINQITNSNRIILGMNWSVITDAEGLIAGDNCPSEPTEFTTNSFKGALKLAAKWVDSVVDLVQVGVNTVKVVTKERLTPKIELFAKFTEYTFLMQCYLELIGYFYNLSSSLSEISSQLYFSWCSLTAICFKRYVLMPTIGSNNHTKLLLIHLEATTG